MIEVHTKGVASTNEIIMYYYYQLFFFCVKILPLL